MQGYIFLLLIVFVIVLELLFPYKKIKLIKHGFWTDLIWYFFVQGFLLQVLVYKYTSQFFTLHTLSFFSKIPLYGQVIFFLILFDFIEYWFHRLEHAWLPLWRIHEVHHSTVDLNWLSGSRQHAFELIIGNIIAGSLFAFWGAGREAVAITLFIESAWGIYNHSNINIKTGYLKYIFNTPEMHRVHHIKKGQGQFSNYATKFTVWDWIFKTAYLPDHDLARETGYGIDYEFPSDPFRQIIAVFRKKK